MSRHEIWCRYITRGGVSGPGDILRYPTTYPTHEAAEGAREQALIWFALSVPHDMIDSVWVDSVMESRSARSTLDGQETRRWAIKIRPMASFDANPILTQADEDEWEDNEDWALVSVSPGGGGGYGVIEVEVDQFYGRGMALKMGCPGDPSSIDDVMQALRLYHTLLKQAIDLGEKAWLRE